MKSSMIASLVAVAASQDVFLASRNSTGTIVGSGMEVDAQGDSCLNFLNGLRSNHGLSAMTLKSSQNSCAANQAKGDAASSAHAHFGACGEHGQCEAMGTHSCEDGIQMYYDEGPGSGSSHGHYNIIMGSYTQMAYGHCDGCGSYGTFWTMNFY